jgi:LacI family transcriptional regulator
MPGMSTRTARRAPRLTDVAARAGVSTGTVSHVLNHPHKVSEATRERVRRAIDELGFVRDANARSLASGGSRSIGLVAIDLSNSLFAEAARGAQARARDAGLILLITGSDDDPAVQSANVDAFIEARVAGLLLAPMRDSSEQTARFAARGRPVVLMNYDPGTTDTCRVVVDNEQVGYLAARHLAEQGCRRIAFVQARPDAQPVALRRRGVRRAVAELGDQVLYEEITAPDLTAADGAVVAEDLVRRSPRARPDGVVAVTDQLAVGLVETLADHGVDVPDELAVLGCDDNRNAPDCRMTLTTVRMRGFDMGVESMRLLLEELTLPPGEHVHQRVVLTPELVARASTARGRP